MNVIDIQHLKITIGIRELLNIKNLQVQEGSRVGIVGKNGSGKTTFFKALLNEVDADISHFKVKGSISLLPQIKQATTYKSGGEISQDYLIRAFNESPTILLADEPTTNLDTSHIEWVERKLKEFQGTIVLVSHDRTLLDNLCDTIWELEDGKIKEYSGNYSDYVQQKQNQKKHQQKEYEKFKQKEAQLQEAIIQKGRQAERATKAPKNLSSSEARIKGAKPYFAKLQKGLHQNRKALQTRLEKLEHVEKPQEEVPIKMTLPGADAFRTKTIIRAEKVSGVVGNKVLWEPSTFFLKGSDKVGIVGPNGSGKTTFIKKIIERSDENLYVSSAVKIGYFAQNMDILDSSKTIMDNVKQSSIQNETLIRTVLARLGFFGDDVYKKISILSGGERVKVSLAKIFVSNCNTLILDEPTNYLDIYALEGLENLLKEYEGTIILVSHDRQFINTIADKLLVFEHGQLTLFEGSFQEYERNRQNEEPDDSKEQLMKVELNIAAVLSKLSDPLISEEDKAKLDREFQTLLEKKRRIEKISNR